jgi:hypothetical protein
LAGSKRRFTIVASPFPERRRSIDPVNFQSLKPQFDRDGYVVVRQLLSPAEFAELNANLDRYIADVVPGLPVTDAFYDVDR